ncbi:hypothetical protein F4802DRAFT_615934 [Xylaria palmicola]|nr:hypothetical protein F4802DRAFT_615934 [Xylaria palmicola]
MQVRKLHYIVGIGIGMESYSMVLIVQVLCRYCAGPVLRLHPSGYDGAIISVSFNKVHWRKQSRRLLIGRRRRLSRGLAGWRSTPGPDSLTSRQDGVCGLARHSLRGCCMRHGRRTRTIAHCHPPTSEIIVRFICGGQWQRRGPGLPGAVPARSQRKALRSLELRPLPANHSVRWRRNLPAPLVLRPSARTSTCHSLTHQRHTRRPPYAPMHWDALAGTSVATACDLWL